MSYESKLQPSQSHRLRFPNVLGGSLSSQDRALAALLEEAFRVKEEVAAGLDSNHGAIQAEVLSRKLLEKHVLTIAHIVTQLSMCIQTLSRQMVQRDCVTSDTTVAVQNLDQKNMAGIGDLRGRVARCDASITKLSCDVSSGKQQMIRLQKEVAELRTAVGIQLKDLEVKLFCELRGQEESSATDSVGKRNKKSDWHKRVKLLQDKLSDELKEAKEQTEMLKTWTEQLNSSVQTHARHHRLLRSLLQDKILDAEHRLENRLLSLEVRVGQFEMELKQTGYRQSDQLKHSEAKLCQRMTSVESSLHQELQLLKQDYHKGFLSVHDAIQSLRKICDIKSCLDKKLQSDIKRISNEVAELSPENHITS